MAIITKETMSQINNMGEAFVNIGMDKIGIVQLYGNEAGLVACASGHKPISKMIYTYDIGSKEIPLFVCPNVVMPTGGAKTQVVEKPVYIKQESSTIVPFGLGIILGIILTMFGAYFFAKKNKGRLDEAFEESERLLDRKIKEAQECLEHAKSIKNKSKK